MRQGLLLVFILMSLVSCDKSNPSQNIEPPKNTSQNSNSQQNIDAVAPKNTDAETTSEKWRKLGICQTPNQIKGHGGNNCIVVKWKCPRCKSNIEDLLWTICKNCCQELEVCIVCNKKAKN
ncbi:hypothetical protein [Candidatus Uabimicrobium sp. HlEnr_7]|uniref:hypothetical protein n=1 Tax=Candidatus Uabimicrobium helgolandensis TaxID=3095367 RepID=UPI003556F625